MPRRLVRHGSHFDFMAVWKDVTGTAEEWHNLIKVLVEELEASRRLQQIFTGGKDGFAAGILHRKLVVHPR